MLRIFLPFANSWCAAAASTQTRASLTAERGGRASLDTKVCQKWQKRKWPRCLSEFDVDCKADDWLIICTDSLGSCDVVVDRNRPYALATFKSTPSHLGHICLPISTKIKLARKFERKMQDPFISKTMAKTMAIRDEMCLQVLQSLQLCSLTSS